MLLHCNCNSNCRPRQYLRIQTPISSSFRPRQRSKNCRRILIITKLAAMVVEVVSGSKPSADAKLRRVDSQKDQLRVKRKTLQAVLEQCQRALGTTGGADEEDDGDDGEEDDDDNSSRGSAVDDERRQGRGSTSSRADCEADELCDLLKSRVECPDFLQKLESEQQASVPQNIPGIDP